LFAAGSLLLGRADSALVAENQSKSNIVLIVADELAALLQETGSVHSLESEAY